MRSYHILGQTNRAVGKSWHSVIAQTQKSVRTLPGTLWRKTMHFSMGMAGFGMRGWWAGLLCGICYTQNTARTRQRDSSDGDPNPVLYAHNPYTKRHDTREILRALDGALVLRETLRRYSLLSIVAYTNTRLYYYIYAGDSHSVCVCVFLLRIVPHILHTLKYIWTI